MTRSYFYRTLILVGLACIAPAAGASAETTVPRTSDGKPNFSGYWTVLNTARWNLEDHSAAKGVPAGQTVVEGGPIPYQDWALAKREENRQHAATLDPEGKCYMLGVPRMTYSGHPFQIFQSAQAPLITILYEYAHTNRFIYMNGTDHPAGPIEWWMGDSRGRWEGDTLVVDNIHFNDKSWFDRSGNFHSEELHVVERYSLLDPDHVEYRVHIEDPKVFTRPWDIQMVLYRIKEKNFQLLEYECYGFDVEKYYP